MASNHYLRRQVFELNAQCVEDTASALSETRAYLQGAGWPTLKIDSELEQVKQNSAGYPALEKRERVLRACDALRARALCAMPEGWLLLRLSALMVPTDKILRLWGELTDDDRRVAGWVQAVRELRAPLEWPDMRLMLAYLRQQRVARRQGVGYA